MGPSIAEYVAPFYAQVDAPAAPSEGSHIGLSADCKGVRILKSQREQMPDAPAAMENLQ